MRGSNLSDARHAKKVKAMNKQITTQKRQITRLSGRGARSEVTNHTLDEYFRQPTPPPEQHQQNNAILQEICRNAMLAPSRRRYSKLFMSFAVILMCFSLPAYNFLRQVLPFPSRQAIDQSFATNYWHKKGIITDFEHLHEALQDYVREVGSNTTMGILAVDAISLTPHMRIDRDGFVRGTVTHEHVPRDLFQNLTSSYQKFEEFVRNRTNVTITDSFIYQFQPYDAMKQCITVFVEPTTSGKATLREVDRLAALKAKLQKFNLSVQGYAFDGDSTYRRLHENFFESYYVQLIKNYSISFADFPGPLIVSDPLHLLKRARYRCLSKEIHVGISGEDRRLNLQKIKTIFDVPATVWIDKPYSKMHDHLAIQLFSLDNLIKLIEEGMLTEIAYSLRMVLLNVALKEQELSVADRISYLEIGLLFMTSFHGMVKNSRSPVRPQVSHDNSTVRMFTDAFLIEHCNTAFSVLHVLHEQRGFIALNRLGSNPVEHLFGLIRMRSRDIHTFEKLQKTLGKIELHRQMKRDFGVGGNVNKRTSYYAQTVLLTGVLEKRSIHVDSRDAVIALMKELGFPITLEELVPWDFESVFELSRDITTTFFTKLKMLHSTVQKTQRGHCASSTVSKVTCGRSILGRIADSSIFDSQFSLIHGLDQGALEGDDCVIADADAKRT